MQYRPLGRTGIQVSAISFGAGPVPGLLTKTGQEERQQDTVRRALDAGVNWFDTAATYGDGRSESSLGAALHSLGAAEAVHLATKVRLTPEQLNNIPGQVRASLAGSLSRLGVSRVTLLQVHNSITPRRGDLATSITPGDVLGPGGMLETFRELRREGLVAHFGLTGLGDAGALVEVLACGEFATIQLPYNILTARRRRTPEVDAPGSAGIEDGPLLDACRRLGVGVLAIRVLAGGALALHPPSEHTKQTKFFPLYLYERDRQRARELQNLLPAGTTLPEIAVRFVLSRPGIASALIGVADASQLTEAVRCAALGPLSEDQFAPLLTEV